MHQGIAVRFATPADIDRMRSIELDAGQLFREVGMSQIADHEPMSPAALAAFIAAGRAWVATDGDDEPVAYLVLDVLGDQAHVEQVTVAPSHQRRGVGALLLDEAAGWAASQHLRWLTLSTFREVPWNAPYYERLGFRAVDEPDVSTELAAVRADEATRGLDAGARVLMRRPIWP